MESTATRERRAQKPDLRKRTGTKAEYGVIAVDPRVIPSGRCVVEGWLGLERKQAAPPIKGIE